MRDYIEEHEASFRISFGSLDDRGQRALNYLFNRFKRNPERAIGEIYRREGACRFQAYHGSEHLVKLLEMMGASVEGDDEGSVPLYDVVFGGKIMSGELLSDNTYFGREAGIGLD